MDVRIEVSDRIATVTLNRPEARNAISRALGRGLKDAMNEAEASDDVDVIILTGADPAFCAGLDLKELGSPDQTRIGNSDVSPSPPWAVTSKPIIGAINGVAITGGFELALQCDFLIASERAAFGDTHTRVGVLPGWGLSVLLPQAIGIRRAIEMSMTGNFINAEEAFQRGLVNHVVPHDELIPTARKLAADIAANNTPAVRQLLQSYRTIHTMTVAEGLQHELAVNREFAQSFSASHVAAQRSEIAARGRNQISG
jgi:enoyl-CoA hydratase